jgi:hypothetical protein
MLTRTGVYDVMKDVMILMRANQCRGPFEGVGPEKSRLFWALK